MKNPNLVRYFLFAAMLAFAAAIYAEDLPAAASRAAPAELKTFLIVMKLTPQYHDGAAWDDAADASVKKHLARLQEAAARGQVILAGRTNESHEQTMGLIIFTAPDDAAANDFMKNDPCVAAGIMTAKLHPYSIAVQRKL